MASYTWAKALSDNVGYYGVGWGQTAVQGFYYLDSTDPLRDYGPSPYDVRHMFSVAANYELPFGKGKKHDMSGAADAALGGWRVNTIFQAHTGLALTVTDSAGQSLQATRSNERPDRLVHGRHQRLGSGRYLDRYQLLLPRSEGPVRDSGVGILHGPGYWNVDFGLSKDIHVTESKDATFKIEAFNVFNHPNFALQQGATDIGDPNNFGRILNTFSAPRIVELALKFTY